LRIDLVGGGRDLDLFVKLFGVIQNQREFVGAGLKGDGAVGDQEEAFFPDFEFVIAGREIFQSEAASAVGFGTEDVSGGVFKFYLGGRDGNIVFIEDNGRADGQVCRASRQRGEHHEAGE
jgi:hypothetical protein